MAERVRTLIVSSYVPRRGSGRGVRTYGIARALAAHGPVSVAYVPFGGGEPDPAYRGIELLPVGSSRVRKALAFARARRSGVPAAVARGVAPELARVAAASDAERVIADDPMAAVALWRLAGDRALVYSAHNLESAFRTDWGPRESVERFERHLLERFAEVWMPSRADVARASALAPAAAIRYVPNVVDVTALTPMRPHGRRAILVADGTYAPNREAAGFLVGEVMPRVWAQDPSVDLWIGGRGFDPPAGLDPRVRFLGFVDDLEALYAQAACAVVPLLTGGGSPLKFVEALAHALPVVATPRAAAGLDVAAGEHYLEGDGADGFAAALLAALAPAAAEIGRRGRALAEAEYSIESLAGRLA